ncbi:hypothetical protein EG68_08064 [Paragonimus skrjabini miyazakii]|uniref:Uncharacterized protein n=1 Tax=Paragonimus skrjabini miyazakii TaxID=59628 RepID=A0A8S9YN08_9TREM|nr:hypothetical protein EG68_08064 [Paragonimus skrjabini miyazakii]
MCVVLNVYYCLKYSTNQWVSYICEYNLYLL